MGDFIDGRQVRLLVITEDQQSEIAENRVEVHERVLEHRVDLDRAFVFEQILVVDTGEARAEHLNEDPNEMNVHRGRGFLERVVQLR